MTISIKIRDIKIIIKVFLNIFFSLLLIWYFQAMPFQHHLQNTVARGPNCTRHYKLIINIRDADSLLVHKNIRISHSQHRGARAAAAIVLGPDSIQRCCLTNIGNPISIWYFQVMPFQHHLQNTVARGPNCTRHYKLIINIRDADSLLVHKNIRISHSQHRGARAAAAIVLGPDSIQRCCLTNIGNPIVEIRPSKDRLISTMGFPILARRYLYIESGPDVVLQEYFGLIIRKFNVVAVCSIHILLFHFLSTTQHAKWMSTQDTELISKSHHDAKFVCIDSTGSCHNNNLWCHQWLKSWHHEVHCGLWKFSQLLICLKA